MTTRLGQLLKQYRELGIADQLDYEKFYLYSLITHSTAIEGSTITETESHILFEHGISPKGKSLHEQHMNLDLKRAYEAAYRYAHEHTPITTELLISLAAIVMKNTGSDYQTALGSFSSARGELRLVNVSAGLGGRSYMNFKKVPIKLAQLCRELNSIREKAPEMSIQSLYELSFKAHFHLVTIHPWADGNGRMARLLMNMLQIEFGLVPSKIRKEDKEAYIEALESTRANDDISIFCDFMTDMMQCQLENDIYCYQKSINSEVESFFGSDEKPIAPTKTRDKVLALLRKNPFYSASNIAKELGLSTQAINRQLSVLKSKGLIDRIGASRGGHWKVH